MFRQLASESRVMWGSMKNLFQRRGEILQNIDRELPRVTFGKILSSYQDNLENKTPMLTNVLTITGTYVAGQAISQMITGDYSLGNLAVYAAYGPIGGLCYYYWFKVLDKVPGEMLIRSNAYQDLFFKKVPNYLKDRLALSFNREVFISDAKVKGHVQKDGLDVPDGTQLPVMIPEGTQIAIGSLNIQPKKIETINKWSLKFTKIFMDQFIFSSTYTAFLMVMIGLLSGKGMGDIGHSLDQSFWTIFKMDCMVWPIVQFVNFTYVPRWAQPVAVNVVNVAWNTYIALVLGAVH